MRPATTETSANGPDLSGVALACAQINGAMQIISELAEEKDDRYWALLGSLEAALAAIEPLKEWA